MQGRITVLKFRSEIRELIQVFDIEVEGTPTALEIFNGKLVAAYGFKLHFFTWKDMALIPDIATYNTSMMTVSVHALNDKELLVADYLEPLELVSTEHGTVSQKCRDIFHSTFTSVVPVTQDTYLAADSFCNIFCIEKRNPKKDDDKDKDDDDDDGAGDGDDGEWLMKNVAEFHVGEYITCLRKTSLCGKRDDDVFTYTTTNGSVGEVWMLSRDDFTFWATVEAAIASLNISQIGGLKHDEWRAYSTERRVSPAARFVDFDLISVFKDLDKKDKCAVFRALSSFDISSVKELSDRIDAVLEK